MKTGVLRSPITSHVLDISSGRPAAGVPIRLERLMQCSEDAWDLVGEDVTNDDGRSGKLMEPSSFVASGVYRISFDTREYETTMCGGKLGFYPNASIVFEILDSQTHQHFHVPRLYSPLGYSNAYEPLVSNYLPLAQESRCSAWGGDSVDGGKRRIAQVLPTGTVRVRTF